MPRPASPSGQSRDRLRTWLSALAGLAVRQGQAEWFGSPIHLMMLARPRAEGPAAAPRDPRPADAARGEALLLGTFSLAGLTLQTGAGGDPWDKPSPSRAFAEALHSFDWLGDLLAIGERGEYEALRLILEWRRVFGRWNSFSWGGRVLERRTFALACALRKVSARASEAEVADLSDLLARHGRQLLKIKAGPLRAAERACAAALAGTALAGQAGERLMVQALGRLDAALKETVLADGGHASRSPEAGMELLLDLAALDDGLSQRGRAGPDQMARAVDRLSAALRVLVLPDGRLACFQGGEAGRPETVAAARAASDLGEAPRPPTGLPHAGYQRLGGRSLTVMVDVAAPAMGAWSEMACAQPLAVEIACGPDRLVTNCGWSPRAAGPQALRLSGAGSTVSVGDRSAGAPLSGLMAYALGPGLEGGAAKVEHRRQETAEGVWLEAAHDGWVKAFGLRHERLLFLDLRSDELRGEDRLVPLAPEAGAARVLPIAVRFHLGPDIRASLARDQRSVLLQGPSTVGWWLRNDAAEVAIEHSVHYEDGQPRRSTQVVLRSQVPAATGGKVRWKLAAMTVDRAGAGNILRPSA